MPQQLKDLIHSFSDMTIEEQFEKIREVRNTRNIERPAAAVKRQKKKKKKSEKAKDKARALLNSLPPEQRELLLKQLQGENDEKES